MATPKNEESGIVLIVAGSRLTSSAGHLSHFVGVEESMKM